MTAMLLLTPVLMVAGLAAVAVVELLIRRPDVAAAMVFGAVIVQAVFVDRVPSMHLGGPQVYATDLVSASIAAAGVARILRLRRFDRYHRWLLLLGLVLVVSLIRGAAAYGMQASVNDFRQYLFFFGVALYFSTFAPSTWWSDRIGRIWLITTVPMMVLVGLRWLQVFAGVDLGVPREKWGADAAVRVIDGPYVFFLACAFILTVPVWVRGGESRRFRWLSAMLLLFVLILDRRTAWLAVVAGLAALLLHDRRLGRRALVLVAIGAVITGAAFVWLGGLAEGGNEPLLASGSGNFTWRLEGWSQLLAGWSRNPADWFVGEPFGSGFLRVVEGDTVVTHPHNFYIETMIRTGLVGVTCLIVLSVGLARSLWTSANRGRGLLGPAVLPSLLAMQVVWFLTWVPGSEQGIVTGLAVAAAASRGPRPHRVPAPRPIPVSAAARVPHHARRPVGTASS